MAGIPGRQTEEQGLNTRWNWKWRRITAPLRALPDFLIIGGMKCGTTALHEYLLQHPRIRGAFRKEVHFFDREDKRSLLWYRAFFPLRCLCAGCRVGEATPQYLFHPAAAERIAASIPAARLIVLLRNPASRAYSNYQHAIRKGVETRTFAEAIAAELRRGAPQTAANGVRLLSPEASTFSYLGRGRYDEQLAPYFERFPRDAILVLQSERFWGDVQTTVDRAVRFLGLSPSPLCDPAARNVGGYPPELATQTDFLRDYFAPHNERLFARIGERLDW